MLTTVLDLLGLLLLILAVALLLGVPAGVAAAGVCCLVTSWRIARVTKR